MAVFDGQVGQQFRDTAPTVHYEVRKRLVQANLGSYLNDFPEGSRAIDIGGGEGYDTLWLAEQGFTTTIVDPVQEMLSSAATRLRQHGYKARAIQGDDRYARKLLGDDTMDVVLSHAVIMYHDDPAEHLKLLASFARPGGVISLMTRGLAGAIEHMKELGRTDAVKELQETGYFTNYVNARAQALTPEAIFAMVDDVAELRVEDWFGIRAKPGKDRRLVANVPRDELEALVVAEVEAGRDPTQKASSQLLHFILRKV